MSRPHLLDALRDRVLLSDGGTGSRVQAMTLDVERDYWGRENCTDVLVPVAPRHRARDPSRLFRRRRRHGGDQQLRRLAGDAGASSTSPTARFEINQRAGELAREAAEEFADGRHRWVLGSVGPGTKLPSLGNIAYDPLEAALAEQCRGLIAGGVDAILIETCQDTLQIKAAVNGAKIARAAAGTDTPIFVQVTVETTGTLLVGPDIAAAATVVQALDVPLIGLNCATGPQEMAEHVRWLAANWPGLISVQPNAGLPELVDGQTHYPLRPGRNGELDGALRRRGRGEPDRRLLRHRHRRISRRWTPCCAGAAASARRRCARRAVWVPSVASLYQQVRAAPGEQLLLHRRALQRQRLEEMARVAGSARLGRLRRHGRASRSPKAPTALDVCTAFVGRDEIGRDERGDPPLHRSRERAAGDRLHRDAGDRERAEAAWRQADHQLDQFRGRRARRRTTGWCWPRGSAPR